VIAEETATRKVAYTPEGLRIELRTSASSMLVQTIQQLVAIGIAGWLLRAALLSLQARDAAGALFPFSLLENRDPALLRWSLYIVLALTTYTVVAGIFAILARLTRRDRITLGPGQLLIERSTFGIPRRTTLALHESVALEFDAINTALIARTPERKVTIARLGTVEDRTWLKEEIAKRGTVSPLQNIGTGASRIIRTVKLEKRPDGSLFLSDTRVSRFGCPVILSVVTVGLIVGGWSLAAIGTGIVTLLLWLAASGHKEVTVNRGSIRAMSKGGFLRRFGQSSISPAEPVRNSILYLSRRGTDTVDIQTVAHEWGYVAGLPLLTITGSNGLTDAQTIIEAIAEASGFPILDSQAAEEWEKVKLDALDALEDQELIEEDDQPS
jgi:hypothetical protein